MCTTLFEMNILVKKRKSNQMPIININNGRIQEIQMDRENTLVTVEYQERVEGRRQRMTAVLVVGPRTVIINQNGRPTSAGNLNRGMLIDAIVSSAMTRSIPPQTTAYFIRIIRRNQADNFITGRIIDINRRNQNFTTISDGDPSSVVRFTVSGETRFFDRMGRRIRFEDLRVGMPVRVRHASFMTASIPPQTAAYEVRVQ